MSFSVPPRRLALKVLSIKPGRVLVQPLLDGKPWGAIAWLREQDSIESQVNSRVKGLWTALLMVLIGKLLGYRVDASMFREYD